MRPAASLVWVDVFKKTRKFNERMGENFTGA